MATRVELAKPQVQQALQLNIASLTRAAKAAGNPLIREIIEKDIHAFQIALNTLAETK